MTRCKSALLLLAFLLSGLFQSCEKKPTHPVTSSHPKVTTPPTKLITINKSFPAEKNEELYQLTINRYLAPTLPLGEYYHSTDQLKGAQQTLQATITTPLKEIQFSDQDHDIKFKLTLPEDSINLYNITLTLESPTSSMTKEYACALNIPHFHSISATLNADQTEITVISLSKK